MNPYAPVEIKQLPTEAYQFGIRQGYQIGLRDGALLGVGLSVLINTGYRVLKALLGLYLSC